MSSDVKYYSTAADYSVQDGKLNVYLPVTADTQVLIQQIWDMVKPWNEYFDQKGHLVAVEWNLESGAVVLNKLAKRVEWQKVFGSGSERV